MRKKFIIGIDEVGRGSLAGPVVVAALAIPQNIELRIKNLGLKLRDSKQLSPIQREKWFDYLKNHPKISYATASMAQKIIDRINIPQAANLAATKALKKLNSKFYILNPKIFLDGGLYLNSNGLNSKTVIKGDEKITAVKLASIVAKVTRDRYMVRLHKKYPQYGFDAHKGYGTKRHKLAINKFGTSPIHRLTFC